MTDTTSYDSRLEHGKEHVFDAIKEIARVQKVDLKPLIFKWEHDAARSNWLLLVYNGKKRYVLRVEEGDLQAWPTTSAVAGKYIVRIIHIMECVGRSQRRETGIGG